jgi:beta-N-acetylhexosaminidase
MNYHKLAGQLIMIRFPGTELDSATAAFLKANSVRGVCLFRQNMVDSVQLARLTADLRAVMGPDALIGIDQEGGAVVRSTWVPAPPAAMALGAADDTGLARAIGAAVARAVKALGFNWNFAPVLDLNTNPDNPVIAERSFGADPQRATELALAWMEGSEAEGVACCVKHFPGHGDTSVDSHRDLPTVDKPLAELEKFEFAPFRLASASAPAMMTAHIVYPALDAEFPATMSRRILHGLLREQWQYRGVIITDGMDMHAIAGRYGAGQAAVRALVAGADMVMALGTPETQAETIAAIAGALEAGTLPIEEARQRRSLTLRGAAQRPAPGAKVRLVVRQDVVSDGVSEAGVPASVVAASLACLYDVDTVTFADAESFDWAGLPADGRFTILASTARLRYGPNARASWKPDLHLPGARHRGAGADHLRLCGAGAGRRQRLAGRPAGGARPLPGPRLRRSNLRKSR